MHIERLHILEILPKPQPVSFASLFHVKHRWGRTDWFR